MLIELGLTAVYCTEATYESNIINLDRNTVLVFTHKNGDDVILLGNNECDHVRWEFDSKGRMKRRV